MKGGILMQSGFSFNGIHSRDMGVYPATKRRAVLPEVRRLSITPDALDGLSELSENNIYNRFLYNERVFQIDIGIKGNDIFELNGKLSRVARWLCGSGKLIFDDLPGVYWDASVISPAEFAHEAAGKKAVISVSFNAKPFSCSQRTAAEGVLIGTEYIRICDNIPVVFDTLITAAAGIKLNSNFIPLLSAVPSNGNVSDGHCEITAYNIGNVPVKPVISIVFPETAQSAHNVNITARNGDTFAFEIHSGVTYTVIDMDKAVLLQDNNAFVPSSGRFFELSVGENLISVDISPQTEPVAVKLDYTPHFIYGFDGGGL